jgi:hypothetical protein
MFEAERITGPDFKPGRLGDFLRLPTLRKYEILTPMSPAHAARVLEEVVEPPGNGAVHLPPSAGISRAGLQAIVSKFIESSDTGAPSCP